MAEPFKFEYTMPSLDWYETIEKTVAPDDYDYFELQLRYGLAWWLIGHKVDDEWDDHEKDIGRLSKIDATRFIKWAGCETFGSKVCRFSSVSTGLDLVGEISKLMEEMKDG